jgi:translation initiation factor IF-2
MAVDEIEEEKNGGRSRNSNKKAVPAKAAASKGNESMTKAAGASLEIPSKLTVRELGERLDVSPIQVIKALMKNGIMATINQELDFTTAAFVANDLGVDVTEEGAAVVEPEPVVPDVQFIPDDSGGQPVAEPAEGEVLGLDEDFLEDTDVAPKKRKRRADGRAAVAAQPEPAVETVAAVVAPEPDVEEPEEPEDPEESLQKRPPVVTVMGHVDHGKTALLDYIRSTNVVAGEAGGITQHIGAYQVERNGEKITFLDTPGHAAFTAMRARGARVTDIAIVVVAATEGVMPQTIEAISHAKAAHVPIIVALNKMDLPEANPDRVKAELAENGLDLVEWGGETEVRPVSAKTGEGVDDLLETISLTAELANDGKGLRANPDADASGTVIEARMDRQRGPLATVIVQRGTLKVGQFVVAGGVLGKDRAMTDDTGKSVKEALPSTPITILGMSDVPRAGDRFHVYANEKEARGIAEARADVNRQGSLLNPSRAASVVTDIFAAMQQGQPKEINLVIKADVQGSLEAIIGALNEIDSSPNGSAGAQPRPHLRILYGAVGPISESDVLLATASDALVIGFNVSPDPGARRTIKSESVDVRQYSIIYKLTEDIEALLAGSAEPVYQEVIYGHAEVRQIFKAGRSAFAGSYVTDGRITRNSTIRVQRGGEVIWTGGIGSLKRFKDDVREVASGYEFGIGLDGFMDFEEGDILEAFGQERAG